MSHSVRFYETPFNPIVLFRLDERLPEFNFELRMYRMLHVRKRTSKDKRKTDGGSGCSYYYYNVGCKKTLQAVLQLFHAGVLVVLKGTATTIVKGVIVVHSVQDYSSSCILFALIKQLLGLVL